MAKQLLFETDARQRIFEGVRKAARVVKATLGPGGRNVLLQKSFGSPVVTKDGVAVAKEVELEEPFENLGAKMVKEVANKTNDDAGDGTTTASLLMEAIFAQGLKALAAGAAPVLLQRGIEKASGAVVAKLREFRGGMSPTGAEADAVPPVTGASLMDVVSELQAIRRALEK